MRSALAVITYRRSQVLQTMLKGVNQHCPTYRTAIFEDCGQRDDTADFLQKGRKPSPREDILAFEYAPTDDMSLEVNYPNMQVFMGSMNVGVASNSNRALKWFMDETDADHLCLCNDDLHVDGDFVKLYAAGHADLGVGMFCFTDFTGESYRTTVYPVRGYGVKFMSRYTGIMISVTRALIEKMGYFDSAFGAFGEEHCDFTIRARMAGGIRVDGQDMHCLDLDHKLLRHQECQTSVTGAERARADKEASEVMQRCSQEYRWRHYYRPFQMVMPKMAGGYSGGGIPVNQLLDCGYKLVRDLV